jgi:hypothetical protein
LVIALIGPLLVLTRGQLSIHPGRLFLCRAVRTVVGSEDLAGGLPRQQAHKLDESSRIGSAACNRRRAAMDFGL